MNQKLVESLAQIILSLSAEEQQLLNSRIQQISIPQKVADLEHRLKSFEEKYHMSSDHFYRQFQTGELGDTIEFFEWNTDYEMWNTTQARVS